jgi:hypothetical protein
VRYIQVYEYYISPGVGKQVMPVLLILCYNGSLVTLMVVSLTAGKFKPLIFSMSDFALSYVANMFFLMYCRLFTPLLLGNGSAFHNMLPLLGIELRFLGSPA